MKLSGLSTMEWLCTLSAGIGSLIPGLSFFTTYPPPMFEASSLLTGGVALAVIVLGLKRPVVQSSTVSSAVAIILVGFLTIILYGFAHSALTISAPPPWEGRIQIGFAQSDWSLSDKAQRYMEMNPSLTVDELALSFGAHEAIDKVWKPWTVLAAGFLLVLMFSLGFILWAYGFSRLAAILNKQSE